VSNTTVDARQLLCPLPVIRTQDHVARLQSGDFVRVLCTDPGALHDIPTWCQIWGHTVCDIREQAGEIEITICVSDCGKPSA
jgi:tRNA 2-thiouridine synthesizing protein A